MADRAGGDRGGAVGAYLARIELRRRWLGVVLTGVLVALVVATVLTATAGARRSRTAFDRLLEANQPVDALVSGPDGEPLPRMEGLPHVEAAIPFELAAVSPAVAAAGDPGAFFPMVVEPQGLLTYTYGRPRVVAGRIPAPGEALAVALGERTADRLGLAVGDELPMVSASPDGLDALFAGEQTDGPDVVLDVVGIVRDPLDVVGRGDELTFTTLSPSFRDLFPTDEIGTIATSTLVALDDAPGAVEAFTEAVGELGLEVDASLGADTSRTKADPTMSAIALALLVLAAVAGVAGTVLLAQVLGRGAHDAALDGPTLDALGCRRASRWARTAVPGAVAVVGGTLVGAVLSVAASPLMPIGLARTAEPDPGAAVDPLVLGAGSAAAIGLGLAVVTWTCVAATRVERRVHGPSRPGRLAAAAADVGAPAPLVTGVTMACERRSSNTRSLRAGATGTVVGVLGVVAAAVFAASVDKLVETPRLYGWGWDATVAGADLSHLGDGDVDVEGLTADPAVVALAEVLFQLSVTVDGKPEFATVLEVVDGRIEPVMLEGRAPALPGEVALGAATADAAGVRTGGSVSLGIEGATQQHDVTGIAVFPVSPDGGSSGSGVLLTPEAAGALGFDGACAERSSCYRNLALRVAPGSDVDAVVARHAPGGQAKALLPRPPSEVERLLAVETLPAVLAVVLAVIATTTIAHAAVVTVRRRGRDLATLRVLGMTASQLRTVVATQVALLSSVGGIVGAVLGVVLGRRVWRLVADSIPFPYDPAVPVVAVVAVPVAMLVLSQLAASAPRHAAGRLSPAAILRAE